MLVLALAATLVGFVLLVAALLSGVLWLAIACVVVCVVGVGFLVADTVGLGRTRSGPTPDAAATGDQGSVGSKDSVSSKDEVRTSDQEQARDWSASAEHEEDPATGDSSEGPSHAADRQAPAASEETTGEIPRASRHGKPDDPPTEEINLDKPR